MVWPRLAGGDLQPDVLTSRLRFGIDGERCRRSGSSGQIGCSWLDALFGPSLSRASASLAPSPIDYRSQRGLIFKVPGYTQSLRLQGDRVAAGVPAIRRVIVTLCRDWKSTNTAIRPDAWKTSAVCELSYAHKSLMARPRQMQSRV